MSRHRTTPPDPGRHSASRIEVLRRDEARHVADPEHVPPAVAKHVRVTEPEVPPAPPPARHVRPKHARPKHAGVPEEEQAHAEAEPALVPEPAPAEPEAVLEPAPVEPEAVLEPAPVEPEAVLEPAPVEPEAVLEPTPVDVEHASTLGAQPGRRAAKHAQVRLHQSAVSPRWRGSWRLVSVVSVVGALGLLGGMRTMAYWNDTASVSGSTVTAGSLDLKVGGQDSYTWTALSLSSMAPGESTAESLTVTNAGSTPFTVSITSTVTASSEAMRTAVLATVRSGGTASTTSASYPRTEACSGTVTYGPAALPTASTSVLGPSATIQPGGSLTFCVLLALDSAAGNATMTQTYAPSFVVAASQA